jgi:hypothetical protein
MSIICKELINSTTQKISSSMKKSNRPQVSVKINGHKISALYNTGVDDCCMTAAEFSVPSGKKTLET